jgi:uncharacterized membrane protein
LNNILLRLQNYGTISALVSWLYSVLEMSGTIDLTSDQYELYVVGFLNVLVLLGIVNNPTTKNKGFLDDKDEE